MNDTLIKVEDLCKIYNPGENEVRALDHVRTGGNHRAIRFRQVNFYEYAWVSRCAYLGKVLSERD